MKLSRQTKSRMRYMLFIWTFTTLLAFIVNCVPRDGINGVDGAPGEGCEVTQISNGALITCAGETSAVILNGTNGQDLTAGTYSVAEIIDPCGQQAAFDEVILRLTNGQLLAHYSDGAKQFLGLIGPGSYVTTDGTSCAFTVNNDLTVSF